MSFHRTNTRTKNPGGLFIAVTTLYTWNLSVLCPQTQTQLFFLIWCALYYRKVQTSYQDKCSQVQYVHDYVRIMFFFIFYILHVRNNPLFCIMGSSILARGLKFGLIIHLNANIHGVKLQFHSVKFWEIVTQKGFYCLYKAVTQSLLWILRFLLK